MLRALSQAPAVRRLASCGAPSFAPLVRRLATEAPSMQGPPIIPTPPKRLPMGKIFATAFGVSVVGSVIYIRTQGGREPSPPDPTKPTVVVLGTGWAGISLVRDIDATKYNVVIISPRNYFLFTPLLPSATTGLLELRSLMTPVRYYTGSKRGSVVYYEAEALDIDPVNRTVLCKDSSTAGDHDQFTVPYDKLVVATGAGNATFNIPGVAENTHFLKEIPDARHIRAHLIDLFERAARPDISVEERKRLLQVVVVGGGPTGVEFAAELHDFVRGDLSKWFPQIVQLVNIICVEALPHIMSMYDPKIVDYTEKALTKERIQLLLETAVTAVQPNNLVVKRKDEKGLPVTTNIPFGLAVWCTGNIARPIVQDLLKKLPPAEQMSRRGLTVDEFLRVKGASNIYAVGDAANSKFAATGQVAQQQGEYLARTLNAMSNGASYPTGAADATKDAIAPFSYSHWGSLAYVGQHKAVFELPGVVTTGGMGAWFFWRSVYLSKLFTMRNKILVGFDWCKAFLFGQDIGKE